MKKKIIIISYILIHVFINGYGQEGVQTISIGGTSPINFINPEYNYFVGDIQKENWNFGLSFAYSAFSLKESSSKFTFGAQISFSYSTLKSVEVILNECNEFNYYGVPTVTDHYTNTSATISGQAFDGELIMLELQPSFRWYPIEDNEIYIQSGLDFMVLNRSLRDKIDNFTIEKTKYINTNINMGIYAGAGYKIKQISITPTYKFIFTGGMYHFGSLLVGFSF